VQWVAGVWLILSPNRFGNVLDPARDILLHIPYNSLLQETLFTFVLKSQAFN